MKLIDLTNQRFGMLTVTSRAENQGKRVMWNCICDCGNKTIVAGNNLRNGHTKSCGCLKNIRGKQIGSKNKQDLTGQKFGFLTVIKDTGERRNNHEVMWECLCECGKITKVGAGDLRRGHVKSCGCKRKELNFQTRTQKMLGKKFGMLTVIDVDQSRSMDNSYNYLCQCDCGNLKVVNGVDLRRGVVASCGCLTHSLGEQKIRKILKENKIPFESEKTFPDCLFPDSNKPARYDFYTNNRLIEFDGRQHFQGWRWGKESFQKQQKSLDKIQQHDRYKNQYALQHNIPLVRIPYWERDNITLDMLMGDKYLVKEDA